MACLPPDQIPDEGNIPVEHYDITEVGIEPRLRRVALLFHHTFEDMHSCEVPAPGHLYTEKEVTKLILRLQASLCYLRHLPIPAKEVSHD